MVAIFFGTVAVNAMNDYTGSLSLLAAGLRVWRSSSAADRRRPRASSPRSTSYHRRLRRQLRRTTCSFITYWIAPWSAIVLVDWWLAAGIARPTRTTVVDFSAAAERVGIALIALVVGFVVSIPFMNSTLGYYVGGPCRVNYISAAPIIAYVVGFIVAGVVYWASSGRARRPAVAGAERDPFDGSATEPATRTGSRRGPVRRARSAGQLRPAVDDRLEASVAT